MGEPSVHFRIPPRELFTFPVDPVPYTLPPPPADWHNFASPFPINASIYNQALNPVVPMIIATTYCISVLAINKWNRSNGNKAWWISKTRPFFVFVVLHNIFLAVFSAVTFVAMMRALRHIWPSLREVDIFGLWFPGLRTQRGVVGAVDALCKMHGPRGLGNAIAYNTTTGAWETKNHLVSIGQGGVPDSTDLGRVWNEGLAFWGWWFYLSKFYEVMDTFIILAKGKRSSTLQTYHHTGAMFCMWAGIRYMSPPIWMFAFLNSGIHALMYTYYTLSAFRIKVPQGVKKTLTTMQISQFLVGFAFATLHLFITYDVPVSVPYSVAKKVQAVTSVIASAAPVTTPEIAAWAKKLAFRAAGQEGLAENVRDHRGQVFGPETDPIFEDVRDISYRNEYQQVPCIDTPAQSFAIWLNLAYLAPLTGLFVRFFVKSYLRRNKKTQDHGRKQISQSAEEAAHDVDKEMNGYGKSAEDKMGSVGGKINRRRVSASLEKTLDKFEKGMDSAVDGSKEGVQKAKANGKATFDNVKTKAAEWVKQNTPNSTPQKKSDAAGDKAQEVGDKAKESVKKGEEETEDAASKGVEKTQDAASEGAEMAKDTASEGAEKAKDAAPKGAEKAQDTASEGAEEAKDTASQGAEKAEDAASNGAEKAKDTASKGAEKAQEAEGEAADEAEEAESKGRPKAEGAMEQAKEAVRNTEEAARPYVQGASKKVEEMMGDGNDKAEDAGEVVENEENASDNAEAEDTKPKSEDEDGANKPDRGSIDSGIGDEDAEAAKEGINEAEDELKESQNLDDMTESSIQKKGGETEGEDDDSSVGEGKQDGGDKDGLSSEDPAEDDDTYADKVR
ncbi:hypothetical protein K402DRAFT_153864 [Aulographum hederae CBS 113979]|uniref:Elongation of fatty acids protein n=1 Tax=Aulographum hederae CBS 113979 TaxID=1176131 RepID=A0A6G1GT63_9PEZI|nr:hypothetical protein K402DRAFT_153864 [Aulographum hederae CBS 113979]